MIASLSLKIREIDENIDKIILLAPVMFITYDDDILSKLINNINVIQTLKYFK